MRACVSTRAALRLAALVALLPLAPARLAFAQEAPLPLARFEGPFVLGGLPDEPGWAAVEPFPMVQYEPFAGQPPTERTEVRFAYDDRFLYASLRAYDRDRGGIRANTFYRDRLSGDDHFEFLLDTFGDNETGIVFTTTPVGNRLDAAILNDASGGSLIEGAWLNRSFNTYWDVQTVVTDAGWFAEVRIPFSSLRFRTGADGRVVMGLTVQRKIARRSERLVFPAVRPDADWAFLKPSRAQKIVLTGIRPSKPVYVTPYVLGGTGRAYVPNPGDPAPPAGDFRAYVPRDDTRREAGLDLKYGLTNDLTLDATINTDFAQAEADDQQVNLTRFNLFFPEKRAFFQERAGLFEFRTGGQSRLFHSRRIGLTADGRPVRILGGARVVGRAGAWDVGVLDMQTAAYDGSAAENFGVVRLRRPVLDAFSYAGGMLTSRIGADGAYNVAYGLDGRFRLGGDDYLGLQWAQVFDDGSGLFGGLFGNGSGDGLDRGRLTVALERRRRQGFGYDAFAIWSGRGYDPGIGFIQRRDFVQLSPKVSYTWMPPQTSGLIWHKLDLGGYAYLRGADGSVESLAAGPAWTFSTTTLASGGIDVTVQHEDLLQPFALSPEAVVPAGGHTFVTAGASYQMPATRLLQTGARVEAGTFYDGWQATAELSPTWYVSPHLELSAAYAFNRVRFPDRGQAFDAHLARLRVGTALDTRLSTNAFLQYNSAAASFSANVRFRYNFREGNDLWVVFNEGLHTDLDRFPDRGRLPRLDNRTFLVKYTHTFRL